MNSEYMTDSRGRQVPAEIQIAPEEAARRIESYDGFLPEHALTPGEVCLGAVHDGILHIGGNTCFKVPCNSGRFIVSSFGTGSLLLIRLDAESAQLLSRVSPGTYPFEDPFHIQGCILQPLRIHGQNHTGRKNTVPSMRHQGERQVQPEYRRRRSGDRGYNSCPCSTLTTGQYTPAACTGSRSNNKQSLLWKVGMFVRSLFHPTGKILESTGDQL
jgi:hypothetical protein